MTLRARILKRRRRGARPVDDNALRVVVVGGEDPVSQNAVAALRRALADAGMDVEPSAADAEAAVLLLTANSVASSRWRARVAALQAQRIVPVRLSSLPDGSVPEAIAALNWVEWSGHDVVVDSAAVVAALRLDADDFRAVRSLRQRADEWAAAGRPKADLVADRSRVAELRESLAAEVRRGAVADPTTLEFLEQSARAARRQRARSRRKGYALGIAALTVVAVVSTLIPFIRAQADVQRSTVIAAADPELLKTIPSWVALNGSALMYQGNDVQLRLGRRVVLEALERPWPVGVITYVDSVLDGVPLGGSLVLTLTRATATHSGIVLVDARGGRAVVARSIEGRYDRLELSPDGSLAVVSGDALAVVDPTRLTARPVPAAGAVERAVVNDAGAVLASTADGLVTLRPARGAPTHVGRYDEVLDLRATSKGARVLASTRRGRVALIDVARPRAPVLTMPEADHATISPDGRRVAASIDDEVRVFSRDRPRGLPTGISGLDVEALEWTSAGTLLVTTTTDFVHAYTTRGDPLGNICQGQPEVSYAQTGSSGSFALCLGGAPALWPVPRSLRPSEPDRSGRGAAAGTTTRTTSGELLITRQSVGRTLEATVSPFEPTTAITSAAVSDDGLQVLVGGDDGRTALVGLTADGPRVLTGWRAPTGAAIRSVSFTPRPTAYDRDGRLWLVPACDGCQTDRGKIDAVSKRLTGCFSDRNLDFIGEPVAEALGVRRCPPTLRVGG